MRFVRRARNTHGPAHAAGNSSQRFLWRRGLARRGETQGTSALHYALVQLVAVAGYSTAHEFRDISRNLNTYFVDV